MVNLSIPLDSYNKQKTINVKNYILILLVFLSGITISARADVGPKPSMKFSIIYKTAKPVKLIAGWQLESRFQAFNVYDTLRRQGPQEFVATQDKASSVSYGYADFHKIILRFDDRVRESNVFLNESFNSQYEITVLDDRLEIRDVTPFMKDSSSWSAFLKALMLTLALELFVAFIYLKLAKKPLKVLLFVILGNLITLPVLWFLLPLFLNVGASIMLGELFAFGFEAMFLLWTCKTWFKPGGAFLLSFSMNFMSLLVGGFAIILMIGF
jgi:hypothetical protein